MKKRINSVVGLVGILVTASTLEAQNAAPLFDGRSLAGWQQTTGTWRAEGGELVGSVPAAGAGLLRLGTSYQDISLLLALRCESCEAGVLLRTETIGNEMNGTYLSLAGPDAGALYRVRYDGQGRELSKTEISKAAPAQNAAARGSDGWRRAQIDLRGPRVSGMVDGGRIGAQPGGAAAARPAAPPAPAAPGAPPAPANQAAPAGARPAPIALADSMTAGPLVLRIAGASGTEVRFKDLSGEDLTARPALSPERIGTGFTMTKLNDLYYSEGIAAADLNRDGITDIVSGPYYYPGPDFKVAREIYRSDPGLMTSYTAGSMLNFATDFTGDGWLDVLEVGLGRAFVYVNPKGAPRHWDKYTVMDGIGVETNTVADVDGDGRVEVVSVKGGQVGYAKIDWANPTAPWVFRPISTQSGWGGHGLGAGDLNADGRVDIVQARGWWERPSSPSDSLWTYHEANFGSGAEIHVYDVDGDGDNDAIGSVQAHGWGLSWFENRKAANGELTFTEHKIMGDASQVGTFGVAFSEPHAVAVVDVDGDGLKDVVSGKRWWAHLDARTDPDPLGPAVLYWFKLSRQGGAVKYSPQLIHNNSGVGAQITVADVNRDGKPDILTAARKGAFIFGNGH